MLSFSTPLSQIFAVPKTARRAKPFVDHVTSFSVADGKIWFRNYQIVHDSALDLTDDAAVAEEAKKASAHKAKKASYDPLDSMSLNEIGPRFVLVPVKIFEGSFGGAVVWENPGTSTIPYTSFLELSLSLGTISQPSLPLKPSWLKRKWQRQSHTESERVQKARSKARGSSYRTSIKPTKLRVAKLPSSVQRFSHKNVEGCWQCLYCYYLLLSCHMQILFWRYCHTALVFNVCKASIAFPTSLDILHVEARLASSQIQQHGQDGGG